jgi:hypothetical protein
MYKTPGGSELIIPNPLTCHAPSAVLRLRVPIRYCVVLASHGARFELKGIYFCAVPSHTGEAHPSGKALSLLFGQIRQKAVDCFYPLSYKKAALPTGAWPKRKPRSRGSTVSRGAFFGLPRGGGGGQKRAPLSSKRAAAIVRVGGRRNGH